MVPAIGSSDNVILNSSEASSYGGATRLPVGEINTANPKQDNSGSTNQSRPVHSFQTAILNAQGLLRDKDRGTIGSSSMRESPSRVFGMSTPGRPIYQGGYTDKTIKDAISSNAPNKNFQVIGRTGGHSIVMDDGDLTGNDQLVRIRTSLGHMIMMNDKAQTLMIIHSNGQSYIELGKEGTIDMYSTNSVNIRTQGDLNLHADQDVNINAGRNLNVFSDNDTNFQAGNNLNQLVVNNHAIEVDGDRTSLIGGNDSTTTTTGSIGLNSIAPMFLTGSLLNLNTGTSPIVPLPVKELPTSVLDDTLWSDSVGWATAPGKLSSIVSRAPAHAPWSGAGKGVSASIDQSATGSFPSTPSASLSAINSVAGGATTNPTSAAVASTVPPVAAATNQMDAGATRTALAQMATNAVDPPVMIGPMGLSAYQLELAGVLKPGTSQIVDNAVMNGATLDVAMPPNLFTGKFGIASIEQLQASVQTQTQIGVTLLQISSNAMIEAGIITGKEDSSQVTGVILAGATFGPDRVLPVVRDPVSDIGTDVAQVNNVIASGNFSAGLSQASSAISGTVNSVANTISSGLGGIPGFGSALAASAEAAALAAAAALKGLAASAFNAVTSLFKPLQAGIPQSLSGAATSATSTGSINSIPGVGAVASATTEATAAITSTGSQIAGGVSSAVSSAGGLVSGVSSAVASAGGSLSSLSSAISSIGGAGPINFKIPIPATDTFATAQSIESKATSLLGNSKIPPITPT